MHCPTWPIVIVAVALTSVGTMHAQQPPPPAGSSSWVLEVVTRGGIAGRGRGSFVVASDGSLTCSGARAACMSSLSGAAVTEVAALVAAVEEGTWVRQPPSTCADCFITTVTLRTREPNGEIRTRVGQWDESQTVAGLRRLADAVIAFATASQR